MAEPAVVLSARFDGPYRDRAFQDLMLLWHSIRACSAYVQQLDSLAVPVNVWGDAYANAQAVLDAAIERLDAFHWEPYPAGADSLLIVQVDGWTQLLAAQSHLKAFEWHRAQGRLFAVGLMVLVAADQLEIRL